MLHSALIPLAVGIRWLQKTKLSLTFLNPRSLLQWWYLMEERWFWYVCYINVLGNVILSFTIRDRCKDESQKERICLLMLCFKLLGSCALLLFYFTFLRYYILFLLYTACSITTLGGGQEANFPIFSIKMLQVLRKSRTHNEATFKYINILAYIFFFSLKCTI